jgi:hypothetical protein
VFEECVSIPVLEFCCSILCPAFIFVGRKVTSVEGENIGMNKEKELFSVMVNLFPWGLRDSYLSNLLEKVSVQVYFYSLKY